MMNLGDSVPTSVRNGGVVSNHNHQCSLFSYKLVQGQHPRGRLERYRPVQNNRTPVAGDNLQSGCV